MVFSRLNRLLAITVFGNTAAALLMVATPAYAATCESKYLGCLPMSLCSPGGYQANVCNLYADPGCTFASAQCGAPCDVPGGTADLTCYYQPS